MTLNITVSSLAALAVGALGDSMGCRRTAKTDQNGLLFSAPGFLTPLSTWQIALKPSPFRTIGRRYSS